MFVSEPHSAFFDAYSVSLYLNRYQSLLTKFNSLPGSQKLSTAEELNSQEMPFSIGRAYLSAMGSATSQRPSR